jgi:RNA recognition motif-containing protein
MPRLFVDNLPKGVGEEALAALFAQSGRAVVSVSIIADRQTGESHGYAFVDMASDDDAAQAIGALHGHMLRGQRLHVSEARASKKKPGAAR